MPPATLIVALVEAAEAVSTPVTPAFGRISKLPRTSMSAKDVPELSAKEAPFRNLAVPSALPQIRFWPVQSTTNLVRSAAKPAKPVSGPACHWSAPTPS